MYALQRLTEGKRDGLDELDDVILHIVHQLSHEAAPGNGALTTFALTGACSSTNTTSPASRRPRPFSACVRMAENADPRASVSEAPGARRGDSLTPRVIRHTG